MNVLKRQLPLLLFVISGVSIQSCLKKSYPNQLCNTKTILHNEPVSVKAQAVITALAANASKYQSLLQYDSTKTVFAEPDQSIRDRYNISTQVINGRRVLTMAPKSGGTGRVMLYIHGGAYAADLGSSYYVFLAKIIDSTGFTIVIPDYGLAPYHNYTEGYALLQAVYNMLVAQAGADNIIIGGDSSGGGFALGFTQKQKLEGNPMPHELLLLSPWLDITLTNPGIDSIKEPGLNLYALQQAGSSWAGLTGTSFYQLSPINGPLDGLPKIALFIGGHDLFLPDALLLQKKMAANCAALNFYEYTQMYHAWMFTGNLPEADRAIEEIVNELKS